MQTDHRVPTTNTAAMRQQQHRKRSASSVNSRKRDRHDLICVVCHAPAMGYNFDQITCESCKAFFRRNALANAGKLKCRSGTDDCVISLETRKRCKACRLKKCFDNGLRKEWIMSEEEKRTKKQKIEDNRRLRAMSQNSTMFSITPSTSPSIVPETERFNFSVEYRKHFVKDDEDEDDNDNNKDTSYLFDDNNDTNDFKPIKGIFNNNNNINQSKFDYKILLNDHDRILLTKIDENYTRAVQLNISVAKGYDSPCLRNLNHLTNIVNELAQISTLRTITFLKLTPEFNCLHEDDRLVLVKHNLLAALFFHLCMCVNIHTQIYHEPNTANDYCYHAGELRLYSEEVYQQSMMFIKEVQDICSNDHLILKIVMLIMIFSKGSDINEPYWIHPHEIFHAQNVFTDLLWKYLDVRFSSDLTASIFSRLIFAGMKAQILGRKTKESVSKQTVNNDHLAPLMQSVLLSS
ncbi:unnamed protein product [Rotaria sordida]|uniref:Nuclear receptor domain-containing protein n=1 Tax=Rotaria sordida TaxID=392033 RepID=A0A814G177_9BILA|nr:unnamed protein product [Rotaria sordida]CAF1038614.1 unnamed protein product [Rotaria sordida]CAF3491326.1 unnamed protein product [Rotaria sordida]